MVGHDGVGAHVDGKHGRQGVHALNNPSATMRVILAAVVISTTQKRPPHATRDAVIVGGIGKRNTFSTGAGHGGLTKV
jgi:hypothetical protein